ncbi:MAG: hypothetical protein JXA04_02220 [Gammaproteobacteria bacterium]|nr:hypothetical protein [Gammaproteobacteria bacterium]
MKKTRRNLIWILLAGSWLLTSQAYAYDLPATDLDKLNSAQRLAARVYQETKDAAGAVKVLEEAGVERLAKGRPGNMPVKDYLDVIEAYAGYLARTADTGDAAAEYLKTVIKADSKRASAYRSLGELYYRQFQQKADPQFQRIYQRAFARYVERILAARIKTELPQHIIEAVYPQARDICLLVRNLNEQHRLNDLELLFNPEHEISELDLADPKGIHTLLGASFAGLLQTIEGPVTQSTIDIDNDGQAELRFSAHTSEGCQRNLFYKKFGEQAALLSNDLLDEYYRGKRICAGSKLRIVHINNTNYIVEQQPTDTHQLDLQVFELRPSGEYIPHCRISPPTALERNLVNDCQAPVCKNLAGNINAIVAAEGQAGSEWLVSDVAAQKFNAGVVADPTLKPFIESPHQYQVDLDNDGEEELIARLWTPLTGGKLEYQYRLFEKQNEFWQLWNLPSPEEGIGPGPWQWFFIKAFENSNYIVAYTASKDVDAGSQPITKYQLTVYQLTKNQMTRLGVIRTQQPGE